MTLSNALFTFLFFVFSAFAGSVSSFFLSVVFVWAVLRMSFGHFIASTNYHLRVVAIIFSFYPAAEIISVVANQRGLAGVTASFGALLSLAILPISSRFLINPADSIANAAGRGAAIAGIISLIFCAIQLLVLDYQRPTGGSGNASVLAFFALTLCCICCSLINVVSKQYVKLLILGAVCSIFTIILTDTRAAWIAAVFAISFALWPVRNAMLRYLAQLDIFWKGITATTILVPLIFGILPRLKMTVESFDFLNLDSTDTSIAQRLLLWNGGLEQFYAAPVFGYGPDSPGEMMLALGGDPPMRYTHYHNIFLNAAIRGGMLEIIALVLMFAGLFWVGMKKHQNPFQKAGQTLILATCIAALVQGMTGVLFTHDITNAIFLFTIIIGLILSVRVESQAS